MDHSICVTSGDLKRLSAMLENDAESEAETPGKDTNDDGPTVKVGADANHFLVDDLPTAKFKWAHKKVSFNKSRSAIFASLLCILGIICWQTFLRSHTSYDSSEL